MAFSEDVLNQLAADIEADGFALLAGAGVSVAAPACAPLFRPLRDGLLQRLCDSLEGSLSATPACRGSTRC
jgi:hypothetical protein